MLCAYLHDAIAGEDRIPCGFDFSEHIAHGLFHVNILLRLHSALQDWRMRMFGRGNQYRVDIGETEDVFEVLERSWRPAIIFFVSGARGFAIDGPEIADGRHFDVVRFAQHRSNFGKIPAAVPEADVAERNSVVGAKNTAIGQSGGGKRGAGGQSGCRFIQEFSAVHACIVLVHTFPPQQQLPERSLIPQTETDLPTAKEIWFRAQSRARWLMEERRVGAEVRA